MNIMLPGNRLVEVVHLLAYNQEVVVRAIAGLIQSLRWTEQKMLFVGQSVRNIDSLGVESLQGRLYICAVEVETIKEVACKQLDFLSAKLDAGLSVLSSQISMDENNDEEGGRIFALFSQCSLQLVNLKCQIEDLRRDINR
ncbi:hypothetical protein [Pseudomonas sp. AM8]|uniref:hypothetical protein n=1 Tax=Pseudomonas sp. AM8 TaxID=2983368 RepID=UPI002E815C67|nr:hypothetical protein [Pseudomonas sp. AM8]